ncbi:MAG TPA: hypothetical protein VK233_12705, partial [Candidatus Dormibacteraeota bacterium]|nr:hypothetical protein [Candidatus Dormibacteraeota bacterium]
DVRDLHRHSTTAATPSPTSSPGAPTSSSVTISIADAIRAGKGIKTVDGLVTIAPDLLDATGRRIVIEDRTAGLEVLVPTDARVPAVGSRIRVTGEIGRAWDAPRLKASRIEVLATGTRPVPVTIGRPPTAALEWRLVKVLGTVAEVHKLGDRWRAELTVGLQRVVVTGLAGARIPVTTLTVGRRATIVGFVRRPYPGATDRRWSVVPRNQGDIVVSASSAAGVGSTSGGGGNGGNSGSAGQSTSSPPPRASVASTGAPTPVDVDLVSLAEHVGQAVRVGGLVSEVTTDGFLLDDGTAVGRIRLGGTAAEYVALLEAGDAVNATGQVSAENSGFVVAVDDAAGLVRAGDPDGSAGSDATGAVPIDPAAAGAAGQSSASEDPAGAGQLAGGLLDGALPGAAGLLGLALASVVSVAVSGLRRYRARRLLARRMATRLAMFGGAGGGQR